MKPICVSCRRFYRMKKTGYYFIEGMPIPGWPKATPGNIAPEQWEPYKIWSGDLWECEGCRHQIISGTGREPISEYYKPDFQSVVDRLGADQFQVNDC